MAEEKIEIINEFKSIPKVFKTFVSEEYFRNCIVCNKNLLHDGTQYLIEKAIKNGYVEFEYSVCLDCAAKMRKQLSSESLQRIEKHFNRQVDLDVRRKRLLNDNGTDIDSWLSQCLFTGSPIDTLDEYQIYAHCDGYDLLFTYMPYMISGEALEDMQKLLSKKTKDELDGFVDDFFSLPPEWKDALKKKDIILV